MTLDRCVESGLDLLDLAAVGLELAGKCPDVSRAILGPGAADTGDNGISNSRSAGFDNLLELRAELVNSA